MCTRLPQWTWQVVVPSWATGGCSFPPMASDRSDISPALLPHDTENLIFHRARDPDTLIAWFLPGLPSLVKVNPRGARLACLQVLWSGILMKRADNANGSSKSFFVTLVTFLFWADSSFYLFALFGYHIFLSLSEPLVMSLPGENRHKKFSHMDLLMHFLAEAQHPTYPRLGHSH